MDREERARDTRAEIKTKKSAAISVSGIILAVVLATSITLAGNWVLFDVSSRSGEVNRSIAHGVTWLESFGTGPSHYSGYYNSSAFNLTARTVFPRAVLEGTPEFNLSVFFAISVPANTSEYQSFHVSAYLSSDHFGLLGAGYYDPRSPEGEVYVRGTDFGGTGLGFWNVTVQMVPILHPGLNISQSQDWLSFTSQTDANLSMSLSGAIYMGNASDTRGYSSSTWFYVQGNPTTFYRFSYPLGAWLGYGSSILVGAVSLCLLAYMVRSERSEEVVPTKLSYSTDP